MWRANTWRSLDLEGYSAVAVLTGGCGLFFGKVISTTSVCASAELQIPQQSQLLLDFVQNGPGQRAE